MLDACVRVAVQAPSGRNRQHWDFIFVEDPRIRAAAAGIWRRHLSDERDLADLLGIPYDSVVQAALTPVAYTTGTGFKPGRRAGPDEFCHWDRW